MGKLSVPPLHRLTLSLSAFTLLRPYLRACKGVAIMRPDGKLDIAVTRSLMDQLQTTAIGNENFSDTVLRTMSAKKPAGSAGST